MTPSSDLEDNPKTPAIGAEWKKSPLISVILIAISIATSAFCVFISSGRPLSPLEGTLLQAFSLLAGLAGSYLFGLSSAKAAAKDMITPHARSSFRRVWSLYMSLSRLASAIDQARNSMKDKQNLFNPLDMLEAIVVEQIATAGDSLEDWRDIVPEEVAEIERRISKDTPLRRSSRK